MNGYQHELPTMISNFSTKTATNLVSNPPKPKTNLPDISISTDKKKYAYDKSIGVYSFDDLLVSCSQEIIANGFSTDQIPDSVKDWVSGKLLKTLPDLLIRRLFNFLIENRDITQTLGYRERELGGIPEFSMFLFNNVMGREAFEADGKLPAENGSEIPSAPDPNQIDIFTNENAPKTELPFFQDEQLIDQGHIVPHVGRLIQKNFRERQRQKANMTKNFKDEFCLTDSDNDEKFDKYPALKKNKPTPESACEDSQDSQDTDNDKNTPDEPKFEYYWDGKRKRKRKISKNPRKSAKDYEPYERIECHVCGKQYGSRKSMNYHLKSKHPDIWAQKPADAKGPTNNMFMSNLRCHICQEEFPGKIRLKQHQRSKHPDFFNQEKLETPGAFISKYRRKAVEDYKEHCHYDTESGLWSCKCCQKESEPWTTVYVKRLVLHVEATHLKLKQAECHICGQLFAHKHSLREHMLMHTGERPHKCETCGKDFKSKQALRTHTSSHTGIYPYNCTICNHGCRQRNRLITHLKTAHPSEWASVGEAGLAPPRWSGFQQDFKDVELDGVKYEK